MRPVSQRGGFYDAFPTVVESGGLLVAVWRRGTGDDVTEQGDLIQATSYDYGLSWQPDGVIFDGAAHSTDMRDPGLLRLANGTLLLTCAFRTDGESIPDGCRWATSTDHGRTWSALQTLNDGFAGFSRCTGTVCQLANGDLLWAIYGNDLGDGNSTRWCKVYRSTDNAASWSYLSDIGTVGDGKSYGEPGLVVTSDGTVVALVRNSTDVSLMVATSADSGATWTALATGIASCYSAAQACVATGDRIIVTQRDQANADGGFLFFSLDKGATWKRGPRLSPFGFMYGQPTILTNGRLAVLWSHRLSASVAVIYSWVMAVPK